MVYISDYLREALNERDIKKVRSALQGYFELNPAFRENPSGSTDYDDAVRYIRNNYPDLYGKLYEAHDSSIFPSASASPKDQYYEISAALGMNFSKERVDALRAAGRLAMNDANVYMVSSGSVSTGNGAANDYAYRTTSSYDSTSTSVPCDQTQNSSSAVNVSKKAPRLTKSQKRALLVGAAVIVVLAGIIVVVTVRKEIHSIMTSIALMIWPVN